MPLLISSALSILEILKALSLCSKVGAQHSVEGLAHGLIGIGADAELIQLEVVHTLETGNAQRFGHGGESHGGRYGEVLLTSIKVVPLLGAASVVMECTQFALPPAKKADSGCAASGCAAA